jgi:hypothetical protein
MGLTRDAVYTRAGSGKETPNNPHTPIDPEFLWAKAAKSVVDSVR